jgi:hypothetical protein
VRCCLLTIALLYRPRLLFFTFWSLELLVFYIYKRRIEFVTNDLTGKTAYFARTTTDYNDTRCVPVLEARMVPQVEYLIKSRNVCLLHAVFFLFYILVSFFFFFFFFFFFLILRPSQASNASRSVCFRVPVLWLMYRAGSAMLDWR